MNILENELVTKYFGCYHFDKNHGVANHDYCKSYNVLRAMQEPIKKGERYLLIDAEIICEKVALFATLDHSKHLGALRLPDRFQPPERKECMHYNVTCNICKKEFAGDHQLSAAAEPKPPSTDGSCSQEDYCGLGYVCKKHRKLETAGCNLCGKMYSVCESSCSNYKKPDPANAVEDKIHDICEWIFEPNLTKGYAILDRRLRELVALARNEAGR